MSREKRILRNLRKWCQSSSSFLTLDRFPVTCDCGWESGGCAPLALALLPLIPKAQPVIISDCSPDLGHKVPHHMALAVGARIVDCRGLRGRRAVLRQWRELLETDAVSFDTLRKREAWETGRDWIGDDLPQLVRAIRQEVLSDIG
jgi:hypothetical protein